MVDNTNTKPQDNLLINKECNHDYRKMYNNMEYCVICGFIKWW